LQLRADALERAQNDINLMLWEAKDDEEALEWNFHDGFSNETSSEENSERDEEVTAQETCQVKQRVRNRCKCKDYQECILLECLIDEYLESFDEWQTWQIFGIYGLLINHFIQFFRLLTSQRCYKSLKT
jgi:hypothetical protein